MSGYPNRRMIELDDGDSVGLENSSCHDNLIVISTHDNEGNQCTPIETYINLSDYDKYQLAMLLLTDINVT